MVSPAASVTGVDALTTAPSTRQFVNPAGSTVYQPLSAGTIFDASSAGVPTAVNAFAALQNLQAALQANDQTGIATGVTALAAVASWLSQQQVHYGTSGQRLASEQANVASQITTIQTSISGIRDTNVAQAASDLTQETTSQQAAISAQAATPQKSLFDYLA